MSDYSATVEAEIYDLGAYPLDSAFSAVFGPTSDAQVFTGLELDLWLTNCDDGTGRVHLTEADATLTSGGTVINFSKPATWTTANLTPGVYDAILFVSDAKYLHLRFEAYTPCGGRVVPDA